VALEESMIQDRQLDDERVARVIKERRLTLALTSTLYLMAACSRENLLLLRPGTLRQRDSLRAQVIYLNHGFPQMAMR